MPESANISRAAVVWIFLTVALGIGIVAVSYVMRDRDHWLSDATMTVGCSLFLVAPIVYLTQKIQSRSDERIQEVRQELSDEVSGLRRSLAESQEYVYERLHEQESQDRDRIRRMLDDTSYESVLAALSAARDLRLLSPIGVRGDAITTDFYLRLQLVNDDIHVHLDTFDEASVFSERWPKGAALADVMLALASKVKGTHWWPGDARWNFTGAFEKIVDVFLTALQMRAKGEFVHNVVEKVDEEWILSDWDAVAIGQHYQVTYDRLDEIDWFDHLVAKGWTERANVGVMLDHGQFLRKLARSTELDELI